jgi:DNA-binding transcriptional MerR regulator
MASIYLEELAEKTGISERNIKYWTGKYELPVEKDGRRNVYPDKTVNLLKLIELLSESDLFTQHFIQLQVSRGLSGKPEELAVYEEYEKVRKKGPELLRAVGAEGTRLLSSLKSGKTGPAKRRPSVSKKRKSDDEIDEVLL